MKVISSVLTALGKGWASFTQQGAGDSAIDVPPVYLNTGMIPQPILRNLLASTTETWNVSHLVASQMAMNASATTTLTKLSEGLWEIAWQHYNEVAGAVDDITATCDFNLGVAGLSGVSTFFRIRGTTQHQGTSGVFRLSITRGQEVTLSLSTTGGAGTSTQFGRIHLSCSRLL